LTVKLKRTLGSFGWSWTHAMGERSLVQDPNSLQAGRKAVWSLQEPNNSLSQRDAAHFHYFPLLIVFLHLYAGGLG